MPSFPNPSLLFRRTLLLVLLPALVFPISLAFSQQAEITPTTSSAGALAALVAGRDLAENQHPEKARSYFAKAVARDPQFALAYLHLALVSPPTDPAFADNLQKAAALAGKASEGEQLLIQAAQAQAGGQVRKELETLAKLTQKYPTDRRARLALASFHLRQADFPAAVAEAEKGLAASPDFPPFALLLGSTLAAAGQYEEAAQALTRYQELLPEEPNAPAAMGRLLLKQSYFQQAAAAFEQALQLDPQFYPAYLGLSACHLLQNKPAKAREQAQLLYEMAPSDEIRRQALFASGAAYVDEGKYDKAIEEAQKRLELAQKARNLQAEAADHHLIGDLWLAAGNPAEGQASFRRALELIEKSALKPEVKSQARQEYLWREATVALEKKDLATARKKTEEYRKQAEARKDPGEIRQGHLLQGQLALEEKRLEAALLALGKADPRNPRTHYAIGNTYLAMGDKARARLSWANAAQFNELQYDYLIFRRKVKI